MDRETGAANAAVDCAVIRTAGKQFVVSVGEKLLIDRLEAPVGSTLTFDDVLLVKKGGSAQVGNPKVTGAVVSAKVLSHPRGEKKMLFKKNRRKGYDKKQGHRQDLTEVQVETISA